VGTPRTAICFITDASYCMPALVAAEQARRWSSPSCADVFVFAVNFPAALRKQAAPAFAAIGASLVPVDPEADGLDAMSARLVFHRWLPSIYTDLLYLDSDIQIVSPLAPLLALPLPAGQVRAALDPMAFWVRGGGQRGDAAAARMQSAGIPSDRCAHYVNSGVLRMRREGWDEIAQAALSHLADHGPTLQFRDQDALNAAGASRILPLSLAWNFPTFMHNAGLHAVIRPAILHFMAQPKPWHGAFPPWTIRETRPYRDLVARFPALGAWAAPMPALRRTRYAVQQRVKRAMEAHRWRRDPLRAAILDSEAAAMAVKNT